MDDPAAADGRARRRQRRRSGACATSSSRCRSTPSGCATSGVTLDQVVRTAGNAQVVSPLSFLEASTPGTGGFIETPQQRLQVRHLLEKIADPDELGKVPVDGHRTAGCASPTSPTITVDHQPLIGDAVVDGGQGLMLVVEKFPGASTRAGHRRCRGRARGRLSPGLTGLRTDTSRLPAGRLPRRRPGQPRPRTR